MTKVESQLDGIVCRYCGLASRVSHARACDCVHALLSERDRLKEHLLQQDNAADKPARVALAR